MMRIAIGQICQESNTFSPLRTARAAFNQFGVFCGDGLVGPMAQTSELGGFIQSLQTWPEHPDLVGLCRFMAWPSGIATADTFDWIMSTFCAAVRAALPCDGLLLSLHGAMVAEGHADVEGEVLAAVRKIAGRMPIVATLDLHANVTRLMVDSADALVLYQTAPHVDIFETGQRAAGVLRRILVDGARPVTAFKKIPMVVPAERANTQDPSSVSFQFRERLESLERTPGILAAGLATVQPWLDIPEMGSAVVVVADGSAEKAETACGNLADEVWQHRADYLPELVPLEEAVFQAHSEREGLVVLSDSADSTNSGAPGDSTWLLKELLKYDWPNGAFVPMVAPEVIARAATLGEGAMLRAQIGGLRDNRFSQPVEIEARIERHFYAKFILSGHGGKNLPIDMGTAVVLRSGDVYLFLTSMTGPHFSPDFFRSAGFDPFAASVLVAKSPCGFRAAYTARARRILLVRAPGCAPADFWNYDYQNIPRPLWPWDKDCSP